MTTLPDHLTHLASLPKDDLIVGNTDLPDGTWVNTIRVVVGKRVGQYETEVFADNGPNADWDGWRCFYPTRDGAEIGHAAIVAALAEGRDLDSAVKS